MTDDGDDRGSGPAHLEGRPARHGRCRPTEPTSPQYTTSYTYDSYGNKSGETDPDGQVYAYTYDANGSPLTTTYAYYAGSRTLTRAL
ncbi:RHS repeat domain-containing protein [Streptomyces sp. NPDC005303]|uniref:RHS repeat domain-containing protein n=1 Tax=Streptomyces sp. NPDC005303 TaxID=3155713 RepID=UPI0033BF6139